jgi:hypothetical protein
MGGLLIGLLALCSLILVAFVYRSRSSNQQHSKGRVVRRFAGGVAVLFALLMLCATAEATGPRPRSRDFNDGFNAGVRAARGHGPRNVGPQFEFRFGPRGRLRSIR